MNEQNTFTFILFLSNNRDVCQPYMRASLSVDFIMLTTCNQVAGPGGPLLAPRRFKKLLEPLSLACKLSLFLIDKAIIY